MDRGPLGILPRLGILTRKKTPMEVVQEFRDRFPGLKIPDPGPEPPEIEGELEPPAIEQAGVVWALRTTWGIANRWGETEEQKENIFRSILPKIMAKREKWERNTARGLRGLLKE